ncbi:MAG: hypothetical protein CO070_04850, partial [Gallionellales bacterium CG_4_9_14_0_8_um_filter_55_61]
YALSNLSKWGVESGKWAKTVVFTPTHHSPLTTHHSPLTTHHSPLTTHHSLLHTDRSCSPQAII